MKEAVSYDDVLLVPKYSEIESRSQIDIGSDLDNNLRFDLPVLSSPMDTVTEARMASTIQRLGGLGVIHRYNTIEQQTELVKTVTSQGDTVAAAIGVTGDPLGSARRVSASPSETNLQRGMMIYFGDLSLRRSIFESRVRFTASAQ